MATSLLRYACSSVICFCAAASRSVTAMLTSIPAD